MPRAATATVPKCFLSAAATNAKRWPAFAMTVVLARMAAPPRFAPSGNPLPARLGTAFSAPGACGGRRRCGDSTLRIIAGGPFRLRPSRRAELRTPLPGVEKSFISPRHSPHPSHHLAPAMALPPTLLYSRFFSSCHRLGDATPPPRTTSCWLGHLGSWHRPSSFNGPWTTSVTVAAHFTLPIET